MRWWMFSVSMLFSLAVSATANDPVAIRNLKEPGSVEVENTGPDISLRWRMEAQKREKGAWVPVVDDLRLQHNCAEPPASGCLLLKHGEKIRPMAWDGYACNRSCPPGCKSNVYLGPGEFRIVISNCAGTRKYFGPVFRLP